MLRESMFRWIGAGALALSLLPASGARADEVAEPNSSAWCHESFDDLGDGMCDGGDADSDTLVIFLHGVVKPDTGWQHNQQRGIDLGGRRLGFALLMPRGRRGYGPSGMEDWWTWPTSAVAQQALEAEIHASWRKGIAELEAKRGKPFARVWIFGFSNGAYYSSSLALRGAFEADGFGIFAGGSAPDYLVRAGKANGQRAPMFVGYGGKDTTAVKDATKLGGALSSLGWPHRIEGRPNVGHAIADSMLEHAVEFLDERTKDKVVQETKPSEPSDAGPPSKAKAAPDDDAPPPDAEPPDC